MQVTPEKLRVEMKKNEDAMLRGQEPDTKATMNMSRILKLSPFFCDAQRKWQVGVVLVNVGVVDQLHWQILGATCVRAKADLFDMVDPRSSRPCKSEVEAHP